MKNANPLWALLLPALSVAPGCSLSDATATSSQPPDYVGNWIAAQPLALGTQALHVQGDGTYALDEYDGAGGWNPSDQGTWSSPSRGVLQLDGQIQSTGGSLVTGCGLLIIAYVGPFQRQDPVTACSMPASPLDSSEACLVGTFLYDTSSSSQSGLVTSDSSEKGTLTLDATRTFSYVTATYQGSAGTETETDGEGVGTWSYAAGTLTLQPVGSSAAAQALAVTTGAAGYVCIGGTCFEHVFPDGCGVGSL
jgi:hypothetical protein